MKGNTYYPLIRVLAGLVGIFLFGLGIMFNKMAWGFEFQPQYAWIGIALAATCTFLEIIWNHEASRAPWTIVVLGASAYIYGFAANFIGIRSISTGGGDLIGFGFILFATLIIELVPEPLMLYAISGTWSGGDFIGQLMSTASGKSKRPPVPLANYGEIMKNSQASHTGGGGAAGAKFRFEQAKPNSGGGKPGTNSGANFKPKPPAPTSVVHEQFALDDDN